MTNQRIFPINTATSCLLKWSWSTVYLRQGTSSSCHRTDQAPIPPDDFASFHNLPNKVAARETMLRGEWPRGGCEYCEKIERAGGMSDRQYQLHAGHDYNMTPAAVLADPTTTHAIPTTLEIYFNNTCNMSCLYCGSHFSSKWEEENRRFGEYKNGRGLHWGWDKRQSELNYERMLADFWRYLEDEDRYLHIRQYQIAGGEPFYQEEFEQSIDFWERHPNPELTFNMITNLKVSHRKFRAYIDRFEDMVQRGCLKKLQISSSLDCWGPQQEYVRWGLDLAEWTENFEYLLDRPWVQQCINSAISGLTIKTIPELVQRMNQWRQRKAPDQIYYSFMTVMAPPWMDPAIFGAGVFDDDFRQILDLMGPDDVHEREHMAGIARQIAAAPRNVTMIENLQEYLTELDRRRGTDWRSLFPWLDQSWK